MECLASSVRTDRPRWMISRSKIVLVMTDKVSPFSPFSFQRHPTTTTPLPHIPLPFFLGEVVMPSHRYFFQKFPALTLILTPLINTCSCFSLPVFKLYCGPFHINSSGKFAGEHRKMCLSQTLFPRNQVLSSKPMFGG
jgi:hypothetical protein